MQWIDPHWHGILLVQGGQQLGDRHLDRQGGGIDHCEREQVGIALGDIAGSARRSVTTPSNGARIPV